VACRVIHPVHEDGEHARPHGPDRASDEAVSDRSDRQGVGADRAAPAEVLRRGAAASDRPSGGLERDPLSRAHGVRMSLDQWRPMAHPLPGCRAPGEVSGSPCAAAGVPHAPHRPARRRSPDPSPLRAHDPPSGSSRGSCARRARTPAQGPQRSVPPGPAPRLDTELRRAGWSILGMSTLPSLIQKVSTERGKLQLQSAASCAGLRAGREGARMRWRPDGRAAPRKVRPCSASACSPS
jgi:hypothetical protein